jgi:hypothetical protein
MRNATCTPFKQGEVKNMINEIPRQEWKRFFDALSKDYLEWETKVEVMKEDFGVQVLSNGLPLLGFVEFKTNHINAIEIILGEESGIHQTHTIFGPQNVFFERIEDMPGGIIEIEDKRGDKTLIYLIQPIQVLAVYPQFEMLAAV